MRYRIRRDNGPPLVEGVIVKRAVRHEVERHMDGGLRHPHHELRRKRIKKKCIYIYSFENVESISMLAINEIAVEMLKCFSYVV